MMLCKTCGEKGWFPAFNDGEFYCMTCGEYHGAHGFELEVVSFDALLERYRCGAYNGEDTKELESMILCMYYQAVQNM